MKADLKFLFKSEKVRLWTRSTKCKKSNRAMVGGFFEDRPWVI